MPKVKSIGVTECAYELREFLTYDDATEEDVDRNVQTWLDIAQRLIKAAYPAAEVVVDTSVQQLGMGGNKVYVEIEGAEDEIAAMQAEKEEREYIRDILGKIIDEWPQA